MSKTIGLICAIFIIIAQVATSQTDNQSVKLCIELEKRQNKASLTIRILSHEVKEQEKTSFSRFSIKNAVGKRLSFKIQAEERVIKKSTQSKSNLLTSIFVVFSLILLTKFDLSLQTASLNIFIILCISMPGVMTQLSPIPPTCIGCLNCTILPNSCSYTCPYNYYYSSGQCYFYSSIQGCTVANGIICVSCTSTYYLNASFMCILCSTSIAHCQTCSNSSICSQCISGYALNSISQKCDSCSLIMPNCVTCHINACITCINQTYFINNSSGRCQLCVTKKLGCYKCNQIVCIQCFLGYALINTTCFSCNMMVGCATCTNQTYCTSCMSTAYIFTGNICIPCGNIFPFCRNCTSTVCTACEPSFFLNTSSKCRCKIGSLIDNECIDIAGCKAAIKYRNKSYCTQCDQSTFKFNTTTLKCDCIDGFLLNSQCSFLYGCITMVLVNDIQTCIMCNISRHFTVNNGQCFCEQGYYLEKSGNSCSQTCGDGLLFQLQCDDGNIIDGDGCNSKCEIQENFICSGGNSTFPTHCLSEMQKFELEVQEIENIGEYNIAKFQFRIVNYVQFLRTLNWTKIFYLEISQQHNVSSISITGNKVTFILEYFEDLEGLPAVFHLNLDSEYFLYQKVIRLPFVMVSQTAPLVLNEYPNELILDILSKVLFALSILSLLLLHFAPCVHKMIALETITVLQLCNLAPFLIPGDSLTIRVFNNLSLSNGFGRQLFTDPNTSEIYGTTFEHLSLAKTFTQNMLIDESFLLTSVLIFLILYFLKKKTDNKQNTKNIRKNLYQFVYVYFWNLVFSVSMALFLFSMIALNCNNHRVYETTYSGITYESTQAYEIASSTINFISAFFVIPLISSIGFINIFAFFTQANVLKQSKNIVIQIIYKEFERLNVKNKIYVSMFITNLFVSFTLLSGFFFINLQYKVFIYFFTSLPFALIVIIHRPYNKFIDNFGICLGQFTSIVFIFGLCVKQYFRIIKTPLNLKYEFYFCLGIVFLLTIFVIISINRFFITWLWYLDLIRQKHQTKKQKLKKSDARKLSYEMVVMQFEGQTKKDYFFNRPKFQEITATDNPEMQKMKEKLRDNLFEKRNLQKAIKTLSDPFDPIRQVLI